MKLQNHRPRYLIASDFDETLFRTSALSPNGVNVYSAYRRAIHSIFGEKGSIALDFGIYTGQTPTQLANDVLNWTKKEDVKKLLIESSRGFFVDYKSELAPLIPEANGDLQWNQENPLETIAQMVVGLKLGYLIDEIGKTDSKGNVWPQPCDNALEFINTVSCLQAEGVPIDFAVISSGHRLFIRKTLDVWKVPHPDILITDDDIRPRKFPQELERRFKPGQLPLALAHHAWLRAQGLLVDSAKLMEAGKDTKKRIVYFGDDMVKDGGMAIDGRIAWGCYGDEIKVRSNQFAVFSDWNVVSQALRQNADRFDGRPILDVLFTKSYENELRKRWAFESEQYQRKFISGERA